MKILVTGGTGFIGTNVCLEARNRGHEVVAFDNLVRPLTEENLFILVKAGVKIVRGDVRNFVDFDKLPWKPEGIVHLAGQCGIPYAQISPRYDFEVNALGTLNVLEYCRLNGKIPVAFAASNKCYTDITNEFPVIELETRLKWRDVEALNETIPLDAYGKHSRSLYGTSKVAGDLYMQEYYQAFGVPTVINRMSCIYGLYQKGVEDQAWVDWFIRQIQLGDGKINIFGTGKQVRDMLWGGDVARLYIDEVEALRGLRGTGGNIAGKPYNIGGGIMNTMSLLEAIAEIEKQTGKKATLTYLPKRHGDQDIWISDIDKINKDLGWSPTVSPKEGIARIIKSYE
jgi:CDP-paratose 2-epimerase